MSIIGSNTAAYPLGNMEQSNNTMFYLSLYLTKNKAELADCINVLKDLYNKVMVEEKLKSQAEDTHTNHHKTAFLFTYFLNTLNKMMEISKSQAMEALIGYCPELTLEAFTYFGPWEHANYILQCEQRKMEAEAIIETPEEASDCQEEMSVFI